MASESRGRVRVEHGHKRIRVYLGGEVVADTKRPFLVWEKPYYPAYGVTVAESSQPRILFETGLPPRYYLPLTDVRMNLLRHSDTTTQCPYKGTATYWSVETGGSVEKDVVWTYLCPLPESQKIAGLACFFNERVELIVDGEVLEQPRSPFSR